MTVRRPTGVALRDEHLPMLADLGLVEWKRGTKRVGQGPEFVTIEPLVRRLAESRGRLPEGVV